MSEDAGKPTMVSVDVDALKQVRNVIKELAEDYDLALAREFQGASHPAAVREQQRKGHIVRLAVQAVQRLDDVLA